MAEAKVLNVLQAGGSCSNSYSRGEEERERTIVGDDDDDDTDDDVDDNDDVDVTVVAGCTEHTRVVVEK